MAELSENQEQDEVEAVVEVATSSTVQHSRTGFWFGVIILLIVIGLAGGGYLLLQQIRDKQEGLGGEISKDDLRMMELTKQITGYQTQLAAIQTHLANLDSDISGKDNHFNKKLADFSGLHQQKLNATEKSLLQAVKQIQRQLGKTRGDWLIADAEYLLSVANQRLHLTGDVKTTIEALQAADQRLRESGDAGVFKVREELTREITEIKKVNQADIVGIYSTVQNLQKNIGKLTLFLPFSGKGLSEAEPEQQDKKAGQEDSNELLESALEGLGDLVTIRHTETPIKSILTAEEVYFIQQQLMVRMEMVKLSLVQRNDELYKENIADAKQWLKKHFAQDKKTKIFKNELDKLAVIRLNSELPDISKSLKMLRDVTKLRLETDKALPDNNELSTVPEGELPETGDVLPDQDRTIPIQGDLLPDQDKTIPIQGDALPDQDKTIPIQGDPLPGQDGAMPTPKSTE